MSARPSLPIQLKIRRQVTRHVKRYPLEDRAAVIDGLCAALDGIGTVGVASVLLEIAPDTVRGVLEHVERHAPRTKARRRK